MAVYRLEYIILTQHFVGIHLNILVIKLNSFLLLRSSNQFIQSSRHSKNIIEYQRYFLMRKKKFFSPILFCSFKFWINNTRMRFELVCLLFLSTSCITYRCLFNYFLPPYSTWKTNLIGQ